MFFANKKKAKSKKEFEDVHILFRLGSLAIIIYIIYGVYSSEDRNSKISEDLSVTNVHPQFTEEKIRKDVEAAFEKMYETPKFKEIKDFVDYVRNNSDQNEIRMLKADDGYIVFVPNKVVEEKAAGKPLEVKTDDLKVKIDFEKINAVIQNKE